MEKIKILVGYFKPALLLKSDVFVPIHMGRSISADSADKSWMLEHMIGDDTGDNISHMNKQFCELTALYWAWKNYDKLDNPDYIGFMHYRRVFGFDESKTSIKSVSKLDIPQYNLDIEEKIRKNLQNTDIFAPISEKLTDSVLDQFAQHHFLPDLYTAINIAHQLYPEDKQYITDSLNKKEGHYYNMFIMKKDIFFEYCEWIFSILFEVKNQIDTSNYSSYDQRVFGFLGERLTNAFIYKSKRKGLQIKEVGIIFIKKTEILKNVEKIWDNSVVACFISDHNYVPYLGVAIYSLISHSDPKNYYDIVILGENLQANDMKKIEELANDYTNISIRFVDINLYVDESLRKMMHINSHFTISTYYRFFLPTIFVNYDKILFLDSDIVILSDIAELYHVDLSDNILGAATDTEFMRLLYRDIRSGDLEWFKYVKEVLKCDEPFEYFQAGVLLFNLNQMRKACFTDKCLEVLKEVRKPRFLDQCILNSVIQRYNFKRKKIELKWNLEWHVKISGSDLSADIPSKFASEYENAEREIKILHYSGGRKPWKYPGLILADLFWKYARETVFFEQIVFNNSIGKYNRELHKFLLRRKKNRYLFYRIMSAIVFFGKAKKKLRKKKIQLKAEITEMKKIF